MKIRWMLFWIGIGAFVAIFGILAAKKMTANFGKLDIDKTLSSLEKLKTMQKDGAFDFEFVSLDNNNSLNDTTKLNNSTFKRLSNFKGEIILLNFWASWCEPCIQEFPDMIGLIDKRPNIKIIAVNRDQNKEEAIKFIESFPEAKGKILFYWDPKGEITSLYGTEVLPESYLIDSNFKVLKKIVGIEDWDHPNVLKFLDSI